jgi:hypothetical protein
MFKAYIAIKEGCDGGCFSILGVFVSPDAADRCIKTDEFIEGVWEDVRYRVECHDITPAFVSNAEERRWLASRKQMPKVHRTSS